VEYPRRIPPGWGNPPWRTVATGLFQLAIAAGLVWLAVIVAADAETQRIELRDDNQWITLGVTIGLMALAVGAVIGVLRALAMVALGISDLGRGRTVEGRVLRVRATKGPNDSTIIRWALDDGTRDEIRAWAGGPMVPRQGGQVRAVVSPRLGYVRGIDAMDGFTIVVPPGASPWTSQNVVVPPPSAALGGLLDTAPLPADS
jgi:hypothetical protein